MLRRNPSAEGAGTTPAAAAADAAPEFRLHVENAWVLPDGTLLVVGWKIGEARFVLTAGGQRIPHRVVTSIERVDVAAHFKLDSAKNLGFVVVANLPGAATLKLQWEDLRARTGEITLQAKPLGRTDTIEPRTLGPAVGMLARLEVPFSPAWRERLALAPTISDRCPAASGFIDGGMSVSSVREGAVAGWVAHERDAVVWLQDGAGNVYSLEDAYRFFRDDVQKAGVNQFSHGVAFGFVSRLPDLPERSAIQIRALSEQGVHVLHSADCIQVSGTDALAVARWLFGVSTPVSEFSQRLSRVDMPILNPILADRAGSWNSVPVSLRTLGTPVEAVQVSIIVPLYGRIDFVEHQLIEFGADSWLLQNAELIYVLDDPNLIDPFTRDAEALYRLYRVPFRVIYGKVNRGFSGANNLGAEHARGKYLLFLNSDVIPQRPGWLQPLCEVLDANPQIGAVGPRLLFASGSIQHAGIVFKRREELSVWINHHPLMGLDPSLDPHRELTSMACITGACLLMRHDDFRRIGGWDTSYLIGDFEDSDLCLKLRAAGHEVAYLPTVELTHLERQSFRLTGENQFRTGVVLYNACRFQKRWGELIETIAEKE